MYGSSRWSIFPGRRFPLLLLLAGAALVGAWLAGQDARAEPTQGALRAGFAQADLTPERPTPLAGYAARGGAPSQGVHDRTRVRAAWFEAGGKRLVVASADLVGVSASLRKQVLARLAPLGLKDHEFILAATHTHSGPGGMTDLPLWRPMVGAYDRALETWAVLQIADAIRRAAGDLAPVTLAFAEGNAPGLVRNRRDPKGPVPDALGALVARDAKGQVKGVLFHFAAHPTLLSAKNRKISADWPGAAARALESEHAGCTALFLNGALGDLSPRVPALPGGAAPETEFERTVRYGRELARRVSGLIRVAKPMRLPASVLWSTNRQLTAHSVVAPLLGYAGGLASTAKIPVRTTRAWLGTLRLDTIPGEPTAAIVRAAGTTPGPRWIVSCAQDHLGYFVTRDTYRKGGYEASMCFLGPDLFERLAADIRAPAGVGVFGQDPMIGAGPGPTGESVVRIRSDPDLRPAQPGYALGHEHGRILRAEVVDLLAAAETAIQEQVLAQGAGLLLAPLALPMGLEPKALVIPALVRAARRLQPHIPDEYLNEMEGLADAAGVAFDAILLENTFLTLAEQTNPAALLNLPARCTNVVALGEATSLGQLLHGSTLDWGMHAVLKSRTRALIMEPRTGHPFVSIGWPGMVGTLRAMGAQGLSITEESCAAKQDTRLEGLPVNLLMRKIVQHADHLEGAVALARAGPGTCGYKLTIASGRALDARVVEVTATRSQVRRPVEGLLMGCDPDAPDGCFVGPRDSEIPACDNSSAKRYPALRAQLADAHGRIRRDLLGTALGTRHSGVLNDGTLLACVFEPQILQFHVALGDDVDAAGGELRWQSHALLPLLSAAGRKPYSMPLRVNTIGPITERPLTVTMPGLTVREISFVSPVPCGHERCDLVKAQLWSPKDPIGVVIQIPAWKERTLTGQQLIATALARRQIATLILPMPGQADRHEPGLMPGARTLSENLARTRQSFVQGLADILRMSLWLETQGFPPAKQAVAGVSLGGHAAAIAFGQYPERFRAGVFMLAGANVQDVILKWNPITGGIHKRLVARGVTVAEARPYLSALEPARSARPDRKQDVLLIAADADKVVAPANAEALAKAYGGARIHWIHGGHYAILRSLLPVMREMSNHLTTAFQTK